MNEKIGDLYFAVVLIDSTGKIKIDDNCNLYYGTYLLRAEHDADGLNSSQIAPTGYSYTVRPIYMGSWQDKFYYYAHRSGND